MTDYTIIDSPVGQLLLVGSEAGLRQILFMAAHENAAPAPDWQHNPAAFTDAITQLEEYFAGKRIDFDLQLDPSGTPFQQAVWAALQTIPYGQTVSYGDIARQIGKPSAVRAVGAANGRNPLPIVVPCHRVIGADGSLTGYGGGLEIKRELLAMERGEEVLKQAPLI